MKLFLTRAAGLTLVTSLSSAAFAQHYTQTNLDANISGAAESTDAQLINGWGLTRSSGSTWWVSDEATGFATLYDGPGSKQTLVVKIPKSNPNDPKFHTGTPTGMVSSSNTMDFLVAPGKPAAFIFSTLDGTIAGWNPTVGNTPGVAGASTNAVTVVRTHDGSSFTGMTSSFIDNQHYLYVANFTKGRVDVFDHNFNRVQLKDYDRDHHDSYYEENNFFGDNQPFVDERLPRNFSPYNVQAIGNDIVVTYALREGSDLVETPGAGLGFVDIYSASGRLLRRLEHGDWLNAPWGVTLAPLDFGRFSHQLLVANYAGGGNTQSAGYISAYDLDTGKFVGLVEDANGKPLSINGIRSLSFANASTANSYDPDEAPAAELYFTAGPNHGAEGLFGYLTPVDSDLVQGATQ